MTTIGPEELSKLTDKMLSDHAVDFRDYKTSTLCRRVQRRMDAVHAGDIEAYLDYMDTHPQEYTALIDSMLIKVTEFFRDPDVWEVLKDRIVPGIVSSKPSGGRIRVWSAGCATGEECYSLAMLFGEVLGDRIGEFDLRVFGTDFDETALEVARRGRYSSEAVEKIPQELRARWLTCEDGWRVKQELRRMVIFARHDLVADSGFLEVDVIACRNVLIYMNTDLQARLLRKFHRSLVSEGVLFLGRAESVRAISTEFIPIDERSRIFRKR